MDKNKKILTPQGQEKLDLLRDGIKALEAKDNRTETEDKILEKLRSDYKSEIDKFVVSVGPVYKS